MVIASMGRKLGMFAATCALGLGLAAGAAAQQALAIDLHQDIDGAKAEIIESVEGVQATSEGITYDVDGDTLPETICFTGFEDGVCVKGALLIDGYEAVRGLPEEMQEEDMKLELIKLPNGCLFLHVYGYCNESIDGGLDRLLKIEVGSDPSDPEFAHNVTTALDCYDNPYLMTGNGVSNAKAWIHCIIGNYVVVKGSCRTSIAGSLTHYAAAKCSKTGKFTIYNNPSLAYTCFNKSGKLIQYSPTLRSVRVYTGVNFKKYTTVKKGAQMRVLGVYAKGNTRLLQVQTKPSGSAKTYVSGYIKLSNSKLFKYAKVDLAG